jgi:tRNA threonylcarbamoyladenosine biosynthesis protein TsaE
MEPTEIARLTLPSESSLCAFGACLAPLLSVGDTLLLVGEIGAGKSVLCRAIIQTRLAALNRAEDVPSPTFTVVQTYDLGTVDLWHCDLYRLERPEEGDALGLEEAYASAITLIEWPDRLGDRLPPEALVIDLTIPTDAPDGRAITFTAMGSGWASRVTPCLERAA